MKLVDRYIGAMLGLAIGDALGAPVEFQARGSFERVTDMQAGGPFDLPAGYWTDDTSMALCLAKSLLECNGHDPVDQAKRYVRWWQDGYMSSIGYCFDIGGTTARALSMFLASGEPTGPVEIGAAGNGSLMRLAPTLLYHFPKRQLMMQYANLSSGVTHAAQECLDACMIAADIMYGLLNGEDKFEATWIVPFGSPALAGICQRAYLAKSPDQISGSGYVVNTLEAALWSLLTTGSFAEAVMQAVNLGQDADTTGAVTGYLAGAYYGLDSIPLKWWRKLHKSREIIGIGTELFQRGWITTADDRPISD